VIAIAAGGQSLAVKSDGTVLAWGPNGTGQLGDGTTISKTTPVQVSGLGPGSGVIAIGAGIAHSLALKVEGTVLAWGSNSLGQLGDGTPTARLTPVQVSGLGDGSGVIAIAPRSGSSLALKSDGSVLAWGDNASGQLGDGTTIAKSTPVPVMGLGPGSGVNAVAMGGSHSLAVKSDGTLWAWGSNSVGQLGDGTFVNAITPVQVHNPAGTGFLTGAVAVVAGSDYSLVLEDTTPPVLTTPTSVVVEATGPSGATATFAASASDPDDMAGPVICSPPSGSVFPIATTTVMCRSTDTHGNTGTASFTVTVLSPGQIISNLISDVATDNFQQASNLLQNVLSSLSAGNTGAACNQLGAFINQVQAQSGKKLTIPEANQLLRSATNAMAALGCP